MSNSLSSTVNYNVRTAEFVSPKHPDKICDQISDAILDAHIAEDPEARVAVDVAGGHGMLFITGEITSRATHVDIKSIVKRLAGDMNVIENIAQQSPEIARGVDLGGAGDQGVMVGYATNETPELLPAEYVLARSLNHFIYYGPSHSTTQNWISGLHGQSLAFGTDGKTQITLSGGTIQTIVASFQTPDKFEGQNIGQILRDRIALWIDNEVSESFQGSGSIEIIVNPCGDWKIGGFDADAGLTGRKLAVDNYGPRIPIGGGAFSGKDPSKVDRSAAYMARHIAVDYLKQRNAHEAYVYLAYAIGKAHPVEATVVIDGQREAVTGYDLTPNGIIHFLDLKRPIYESLARDGHHFSRDLRQ